MPKVGDDFVGISFPSGSEVEVTVTDVQDGWLIKGIAADGRMMEVLDPEAKCPEEIEDVLKKLVAEKDRSRRDILTRALQEYALKDRHQGRSGIEHFSTPTSLDTLSPAFEIGCSKELEYESYKGSLEIRTYLTVKNPQSEIKVQLQLFKDTPQEQLLQMEENLRNTLNPRGLKTIALVMHECHHNGRQPFFKLSANRCLDLLGYKRDKKGWHRSANRKRLFDDLNTIANEIIFCVDKRQPKNAKKDIALQFRGRLFTISSTYREVEVDKHLPTDKGDVVDEGVWVFVHPEIYKYVHNGYFAYLPDQFLKIDPVKHGKAIHMVFEVNQQWRIGWLQHHGRLRISLRSLAERCGFRIHKRRDLKQKLAEQMKAELRWAKDDGYFKTLTFIDEGGQANPLDEKVEVTPPGDNWLVIGMTRNEYEPKELFPPAPPQEISNADIRLIRKEYGLNRKEFAEVLGVSYSLLDKVERGKRNVSGKIEKKIRAFLKCQQVK